MKFHHVLTFLATFFLFSIELVAEEVSTVETKSNNAAVNNATLSACDPYRKKDFIPEGDVFVRNPNLLLSFPSSGNIWVRRLIEAVTGVHTGSVYSKKQFVPDDYEYMMSLFEAESRCGVRLSSVAGYTSNFEMCSEGLCLSNAPRDAMQKCKRGWIRFWTKVIFVARNPMDLIVSEFRRNNRLFMPPNSNMTITKISSYLYSRWSQWSLDLAEEIRYSWETKLYPILKGLEVAKSRESDIASGLLVLRYENLINQSLRYEELARVPGYLKFPYEPERVPCAFSLAEENRITHPRFLTLPSLMNNNRTLACKLWGLIKDFSGNMSYANPWPGLMCDESSLSPTAQIIEAPPLVINTESCLSYNAKTVIDERDLNNRTITMLLSFPGAGNTWTRLLIEGITGVLTGSVYEGDTALEEVFPGEVRCDTRLSAVKGHPFSFDPCGTALCLNNGPKIRDKCKRGRIRSWGKFLFIARDPMSSILSEFQRHVSGSHSGVATKVSRYLKSRWNYWAANLAHDIQYDWDFKVKAMMDLHSPQNFLAIKYEDLVSKTHRYEALRQIQEYLGFPFSETQLKCAIYTSDEARVHRHSKISLRSLMDTNTELQCRIWPMIKNFATYFNYTYQFANTDCSQIIQSGNHSDVMELSESEKEMFQGRNYSLKNPKS